MPLAIPLIILLAYLVASGAAASAIASAKAHTGWLPSWLKSAFFFVVPVAQVFLALGKWLTHHLGHYAAAIENKAQRWFGDLAHYTYVTGYWSLLWPVRLAQVVEHLATQTIPRAINARTKPLSTRIDAVEAQAKATAGYAHSLPKVSKGQDEAHAKAQPTTLPMPWAGEWDWIHHHWKGLKKAVTNAEAGAIAAPGHIVRPIPVPWPFHLSGIRKRLGKLELLLGATGAALLVARAIGGITGNCVKNGALGKVARKLCGLNAHSLENLLGLIADVFLLENICTVIPWVETAASEIGVPLVAALTDVTAGLCKGSIGAAQPLNGPTPVTPEFYSGALTLPA